jgi:hypothetical protein
MRTRLPSPDGLKIDKETLVYLSKLVQALERALERLPETPFMKDQIQASAAFTELYTFDPTTATLDDMRRVVATFFSRLRQAGVLP